MSRLVRWASVLIALLACACAAYGEGEALTGVVAEVPVSSGAEAPDLAESGAVEPAPEVPAVSTDSEVSTGSQSSSGSSVPPVGIPRRATFAFQIPTYWLEKSDPERDAYSCDPAQDACKVNLDLSPTFSGESASAWACELDFGMGELTGEEGKCNPNTVTLTGSSVTVRLRAWRKADPSEAWVRELAVTVGAPPAAASGSAQPPEGTGSTGGAPAGGAGTGASVPSGTGSSSTSGSGSSGPSFGAGSAESGSGSQSSASGSGTSSPAAALSPVVLVQSGLDGQGRCLKADCAANFASSLSGSSYSCAWDLGGGTFSSATSSGSCNPSYARFPVSSGYRVRLDVTDRSGGSGSAFLDVLNPFSAPAPVTTVVVERSSAPSSTVVFAPVARIALQGRLSSSKWADGKSAGCLAETSSGCVFNFDGRGSSAAEGAAYAWDWGFGSGASGPNPRDVRFPVGDWTVRLRVTDAYGSSSDEWSVSVAREAPARKVETAAVAEEKTALASAPAPADPAPACGYLADGKTWACAVAVSRPDSRPAPAAYSSEPFGVKIVAQGPWGAGRSFSGGTYACAAKEPECSVNFSAEVAGGKASAWAWDVGGVAFSGANPPSRGFPRGTTQVTVAALGPDGNWVHDAVRVMVSAPTVAGKSAKKTASAKPAKKAVAKRAVGTAGVRASYAVGASPGIPDLPARPTLSAEPQGPLAANAPIGWAALAASGASGLSWLLARRWGR